jgi:nucleoside-diphosphate-sugar epimerase
MNILVTGASGFIGSNIISSNLLNQHTFYSGTRYTINLFSKSDIKSFIEKNRINIIIHSAIEGGRRTKIDSINTVYKNLLMFENLVSVSHDYCELFINFGSGAEFDRVKNIHNAAEFQIFDAVPADFYGFSKNVIAKRLFSLNTKFINIRLFGCFYHNEASDRMIKANIINYLNRSSMKIYQNKFMDFIYFEDLAAIIDYYITRTTKYDRFKDINAVYLKKYTLNDICNIINNLSDYKVNVNISDQLKSTECLNYTGNGNRLASLPIKLIGLEQGIKKVYETLYTNL